MRYKSIAIITTVLGVSSYACADLVSVDVVAGPFQHPDGQHETWRIIVRFDSEFDRLPAIAGLAEKPYNPIEFIASSELYNQGIFSGQTLNDFPSVGIGGEAHDTYVTIGATTFPANTQFTPGFIDKYPYVPPPLEIIKGDHIGPIYDGAWFYFGEPPLVGQFDSIDGNDTIDVVVAQFTLPNFSSFSFTGNAVWFNEAGKEIITPFEVGIPAPATLALFMIAGITAKRRRKY